MDTSKQIYFTSLSLQFLLIFEVDVVFYTENDGVKINLRKRLVFELRPLEV